MLGRDVNRRRLSRGGPYARSRVGCKTPIKSGSCPQKDHDPGRGDKTCIGRRVKAHRGSEGQGPALPGQAPRTPRRAGSSQVFVDESVSVKKKEKTLKRHVWLRQDSRHETGTQRPHGE